MAQGAALEDLGMDRCSDPGIVRGKRTRRLPALASGAVMIGGSGLLWAIIIALVMAVV
jgi:hypothetical protein